MASQAWSSTHLRRNRRTKARRKIEYSRCLRKYCTRIPPHQNWRFTPLQLPRVFSYIRAQCWAECKSRSSGWRPRLWWGSNTWWPSKHLAAAFEEQGYLRRQRNYVPSQLSHPSPRTKTLRRFLELHGWGALRESRSRMSSVASCAGFHSFSAFDSPICPNCFTGLI